MASNLGAVQVSFAADISNFTSGCMKVQGSLSAVSSSAKTTQGTVEKSGGGFLSLTKAMLTAQAVLAAVKGAFDFLKDTVSSFISEASEAQDNLAQTNAVLKSTHGVAGMTSQAILDLASKFSHLTKFTDDQIQVGENLLLTFTNIGKNIFPQATEAMLNMAQAMGTDTKSAAEQLGKALQDPIAGMSALRRVGVQFDDAQKNLIKTYMQHGELAKAQAVILKELQKEFGNSAVAAGTTFAGKMAILNQSLDDVKESIGTALLPILSDLATGFSNFISSKGVQDFIAGVGQKLRDGIKWIGDELAKVDWKGIGDTIGGAFDQINTTLGQVDWKGIGKAFSDIGDNLKTMFGPATEAVSGWMQPMGDAANNIGSALTNLFAPGIESVKTSLSGFDPGAFGTWLGDLTSAGMQTATQTMMDLATGINNLKQPLTDVGNFLSATFAPAWQTWNDVLTQLKPQWDAMVAAIQPALPMFELIGQIIGTIVVLALMLLAKTVAMLAQGAALAFGIISSVVMVAVTTIAGFASSAKKFIDQAVGFIAPLAPKVQKIFEDARSFVVSKWEAIKKAVSDAIAAVVQAISDKAAGIRDALVAGFQWAKDIIWGIYNTIIGWINDILSKLGLVNSSAGGGSTGAGQFGVTNWRGGPIVVGEAGRETVWLPRGSTVWDNADTEAYLSGAGARTYTAPTGGRSGSPQVVHAHFYFDTREFASALIPAMASEAHVRLGPRR